MEQHFSEFRTRLIRSFCILLVLFFVCYHFSDELYNIISNPVLIYLDPSVRFVSTQIITPFVVSIQISFLFALLICAPYLLYQIWMFLKPGLYRHERKHIAPIIVASTILFYIGFIFGAVLICPKLIDFFSNSAPVGVQVLLDIGSYVDFITTISIATGIAFQIPLITNTLIRYKIFTKKQCTAKRKHIIVLSLVIGMLLAPPDLASQLLLACPMWILFELGLLSSYAYYKDKQITASSTN